MKIIFYLLLAVQFSQITGISATLEQFWPWIAPKPLAFGTSFADFSKSHPSAAQFTMYENKPGEPYNGGLLEKLPDGSKFIYNFLNGKLESAAWIYPPNEGAARMVYTIRDSLSRTCGKPTFGTTGRLKTHGGRVPIVWEQYRPNMDENYKITLKATSEGGIEVDLFNETEVSKHGIKTVPLPYIEDQQAINPEDAPGEQVAPFIDFLAAARAESKQPEDQNPEDPSQEPASKLPATNDPKPDQPDSRATEAAPENNSISRQWMLGSLILALLVWIAFALRKRKQG
jgi:hypothetical protein